jgi:hypothetical protein
MSILLAAMLLAGSQSAAQDVSAQPTPVAHKKPKQICEYMEVTGSRSKKRVCRDAEGNLNLGPGISSGGNVQAPKSEQTSTPSR